MVFICAVLFTIIWWNVSHSRSNWLFMFIVLIVLSVLAAIYAARGVLAAIATYMHSKQAVDGRGAVAVTFQVRAGESPCSAIQCRSAASSSYGGLSETANPCAAG